MRKPPLPNAHFDSHSNKGAGQLAEIGMSPPIIVLSFIKEGEREGFKLTSALIPLQLLQRLINAETHSNYGKPFIKADGHSLNLLKKSKNCQRR